MPTHQRKNLDSVERRTFGFEVRSARAAGSDAPKLEGYAAVFNRQTVLIPADAMWEGSPEVREVIDPGAFTKTLREADFRAVWNHNTDIILGRKSNRTVSAWEDEKGLGTEILPPDTALIRDMVIAPIDRGDVDQMSFAFQIIKEEREEKRTADEWWILYRLKEVRLIEVSPVAIPAYDSTEIAVSARSKERIEQFMQERREALALSEPVIHSEEQHEEKPEQQNHSPSEPDVRHFDASRLMALEIEKAMIADAA